jgi:hypothetical protein
MASMSRLVSTDQHERQVVERRNDMFGSGYANNSNISAVASFQAAEATAPASVDEPRPKCRQ